MTLRIVSLCPSLTELVFDLGRGDDLVGITRFCVHPADGVGAVEKVGGTKDPDVARVIALAPDLVLMNEEENRLEDAEALRAAGVRCHASFPRTVDDTSLMIRRIGAELERPAEAERIAVDLDERVARVRAEAEGLPPVRCAYLIWRKPWMSVNGDTFAHALLTMAGGENVFAGREERYPTIELEQLAGVDLVLLCTEPFAFRQDHTSEVRAATGLPLERIRIADGEYLSWHGSRTPDGVDYAARLIRESRG